MGLYDEIMQYKNINFSMINENQETDFTMQDELSNLKKTKLHPKKIIKEYDFEKLVNDYFRINFRLNSTPKIIENNTDLETQFTVHEIDIFQLHKLHLDKTYTFNIKERTMACSYYIYQNSDFYLDVRIDKNRRVSYNANYDIEMKTQNGISFCAYYESDNSCLTVSVLVLQEHLGLEKKSLSFCDEKDAPLINFSLDSNNELKYNFLNNLIVSKNEKNKEFHLTKAINRANGVVEKLYYHLIIDKRVRQIDGIFNIPSNSLLFDYLFKKINKFEQISTEKQKNEHPFQIKLNFDLNEKKNEIKKLYIESKSSSNGLNKTIEQFSYHCKYLVSDKNEINQALFLLFIQNHPKTLNISDFKPLFNLERLIAIILIHPLKFNKLSFIREGEYTREQMSLKNMVDQALETRSEYSGTNSLSNKDYKTFIFSQSSNKQIKSNDFQEVVAEDSKTNNSQVIPFDGESLPDVIKYQTNKGQRLDNFQFKGLSEYFKNNADQKKIEYLNSRIDEVAYHESFNVEKLKAENIELKLRLENAENNFKRKSDDESFSVKKLSEEVVELKEKLGNAEKEVKNLERKSDQESFSVKKLSEEVVELKLRLENAEKEVKNSQADNIELKLRLENAEKEVKNSQADNIELKLRLENAEKEVKNSQADNIELKLRLENAEKEVKNSQAENIELKLRLENAEKVVKNSQADNIELKLRLENAEKEVKNSQRKSDQESLNVEKLKAENIELKLRLENAEKKSDWQMKIPLFLNILTMIVLILGYLAYQHIVKK